MRFETFAEIVRGWQRLVDQRQMDPQRLRALIANLMRGCGAVDLSAFATVDEVLAACAAAPPPRRRSCRPKPAPWPPAKPASPPPAPAESAPYDTTARKPHRRQSRACVFLRQQLADGPRPGEEIEAAAEVAAITPGRLVAATDILGVVTQRGVWRLPVALFAAISVLEKVHTLAF